MEYDNGLPILKKRAIGWKYDMELIICIFNYRSDFD